MKRVALACCRATPAAPSHELYPDADSDLLVTALGAIGAEAHKVSWDDPEVEWAGFDAVVVRSTWDGIDRPGEYLDWARRVAGLTTLQNPAEIIEWNIDKAYLRDLEAQGVPTIPTVWVSPGESWVMPQGEFIVKPAIASGARNTARYSPDAAEAAFDHVTFLGSVGQTVLIQEYLPAVEHEGETSIVFIGGQMSHAVRKGGFLNLDEGILERPWERMTYLGAWEPSADQVNVANSVFEVAQQRATKSLCYGRVDLVPGHNADPLVIEMELIDPFLSLSAAPLAAAALAQAIMQ